MESGRTRHVRETLKAKLAVNSPSFDLALNLPGDTDGLPPPAPSSSVFPPASEG
jgi:hypothetical protein